jgi:hypothetical protein
MRKVLCAIALAAVVALSVLGGLAQSAQAQSETFTFVCDTASGTQTFELGKPNGNSAVFTDGSTTLVSAIGASITGGAAQSAAVECTVNGEGPFPFLIVR